MPIVDSAVEHGLAPLLDEAVRDDDVDGDHDALVQLAMHSLESAADTNAAIEALGTLLDVSGSLGIEIAVFKGLAIGARWHPRPELRPAVDIDVFFDPDQRDRLGDLVAAFDPDPGSRESVDHMAEEGRIFEYSFFVDGVAVDLHVDPMNLVVATKQQHLMWQHTDVLPISGGRVIRVLDLELSIIQALLHLVRDDFADLLHVFDVSLMIDNDPDWEFIETFAATEGWTDLIRFSLGVVCDTFGRPSPLPRPLTPTNRSLIAVFWPGRIRLRGTERFFQGAQRQSMASLLITGRRLDVARALTRRIFPPRHVIDDRFGGHGGPYPLALYRWRRAQRAEIKQLQRGTKSADESGHPGRTPAATGTSHEAI